METILYAAIHELIQHPDQWGGVWGAAAVLMGGVALLWLFQGVRDRRTEGSEDWHRQQQQLAEHDKQSTVHRGALDRAKEHLKAGEPIYSYPVQIPAHTYQIGLAALVASLVALQGIAAELEVLAASNAADEAEITRVRNIRQELAQALLRVQDILRRQDPHIGGEKTRDEWQAIYGNVGTLHGRVEYCFFLLTMQGRQRLNGRQ